MHLNLRERKKGAALLTAGALAMTFTTAWGAPDVSGRIESGTQTAHLEPLARVYSLAVQQAGFASPAFQRVWQRTDQQVASGAEKRSWYWGPAPNTGGLQEDYAEGQGGKRLVQYFDKSRMEINNPSGDPNSPFYVTNGLLTVELISGKMQVGNAAYTDRWPADIPLASDPDDPNAPTYLSFRDVSNTPLGDHPAASALNTSATATITRDGTVGNDPTKASYPDVAIAYFEPITKHNVPKAIWDFLNLQASVLDPATGQTSVAKLSDPWFYATGYPISEAYWARVKIAGQPQDVLIQAFQRRIVTYAPNGAPGFKVQMGNIGQHYYDWRYKDAGKPAGTPIPAASPSPQAPTVQPTSPAPPTRAATQTPNLGSCADVPPAVNGTVSPDCGPRGTRFIFTGTGFRPGESVTAYITFPDQSVCGPPQCAPQEPFRADDSGSLAVGLTTGSGAPLGIWATTMEGLTTHRKAISYFKIIP